MAATPGWITDVELAASITYLIGVIVHGSLAVHRRTRGWRPFLERYASLILLEISLGFVIGFVWLFHNNPLVSNTFSTTVIAGLWLAMLAVLGHVIRMERFMSRERSRRKKPAAEAEP
jgi:drug/metabolite transporter (DMT)-like permease